MDLQAIERYYEERIRTLEMPKFNKLDSRHWTTIANSHGFAVYQLGNAFTEFVNTINPFIENNISQVRGEIKKEK